MQIVGEVGDGPLQGWVGRRVEYLAWHRDGG